jgi:hypothetical protein
MLLLPSRCYYCNPMFKVIVVNRIIRAAEFFFQRHDSSFIIPKGNLQCYPKMGRMLVQPLEEK